MPTPSPEQISEMIQPHKPMEMAKTEVGSYLISTVIIPGDKMHGSTIVFYEALPAGDIVMELTCLPQHAQEQHDQIVALVKFAVEA